MGESKSKINGEIPFNIIWAPGATPKATKQTHWESMWDVQAGDIIIHYSSDFQKIMAISHALAPTVPSRNPFVDDQNWEEEGKQIHVVLASLEVPIPKTDIPIEAHQAASGKG